MPMKPAQNSQEKSQEKQLSNLIHLMTESKVQLAFTPILYIYIIFISFYIFEHKFKIIIVHLEVSKHTQIIDLYHFFSFLYES